MFDYITFLTDFGLQDDFVGVCRGVMKRIARDAEILDVTHGIAPQAVTQGALVLSRAIPYLPPAVHLAVVDPGVGSDRRAVAIRAGEGRVFVGPDNGLLMLAADAAGVEAARSLTNPRYHLERVSRTFHARDLFSPVAAHLAAGAHFDDLGDEVDPVTLVRIQLPAAHVSDGELIAAVIDVDRFGNLELNVSSLEIAELGLAPGNRVELRVALTPYYAVAAHTYADANRGELIVYEGSYGYWNVAINGGSAATLTESVVGDEVRIRPVA
jgi:S-adenosyl-L-methionine hydrolase (adenosine-forming)